VSLSFSIKILFPLLKIDIFLSITFNFFDNFGSLNDLTERCDPFLRQVERLIKINISCK